MTRLLPAEGGEDWEASGISEDPIIQVVTHLAASRVAEVVMREIINPLMSEIYKLADTAGPIGREIHRRLGVVDDTTVTLVYGVVPDVVTIVAYGLDREGLAGSIDEMVEAPLRKAGWTRADLDALIQRRFEGFTEERIQAALPTFRVESLVLREKADADALTTEDQAIEWADAFIVTDFENTFPEQLMKNEREDYFKEVVTLAAKFENVAEAVLNSVRLDDEHGMDLERTYEGLGGSAAVGGEVEHRDDIRDRLDHLADAMGLHELGDDVAALELIRSKINPKP